MDAEHADVYDAIQGSESNNESIEKQTICYIGFDVDC